jgi:hypothetical protein
MMSAVMAAMVTTVRSAMTAVVSWRRSVMMVSWWRSVVMVMMVPWRRTVTVVSRIIISRIVISRIIIIVVSRQRHYDGRFYVLRLRYNTDIR